MNVLFITNYSKLYGANRSLINLVLGLRIHNIDSVILVPEHGDITEFCSKNSIKCIVEKFEANYYYPPDSYKSLLYRIRTWISRIKLYLRRMRYIPSLYKKIKEIKPDIIYSNSSIIGVGIILAILLRKPHVWHIREFGKLFYNFEFELGNRFFKILLRKSKGIIYNSYVLKNYFSLNLSARENVVYNGVVFEESLKNRRSRSLNKNTLSLAIVGLIVENKGVFDAVKAMAIILNKTHKKVSLKIIGDGNEHYINLLKNFIVENKLENNIFFTGFIKDNDSIYTDVDILLMCSKNEAMGRVTVEAFSNGIPVIGYDSGGTSELINDCTTGFLYKTDENELAERILKLSEDSKLYANLSKNVLEYAKNFTIEKYAEKIADILESC